MDVKIQTRLRRVLVTVAFGTGFLCGWTPCTLIRAADLGETTFNDKCASCHGDDGQGVADAYDEPLYGNLSIAALARRIERTMPEDDPEACVGSEARQVAEYIHRQFYSLEARQNKGLEPVPQVELARLTVPQYRNAIADLIGRFTPVPRPDVGRRGRQRQADTAQAAPEPGLRGEYYQSRGMSKANKLWLERVDRFVDFDFDQFSPAEGITADQFAIIWQGAVETRDTGHYEFRIRTQNGARLYVNNDPVPQRRRLRDDSSVAGQSALIDAWVGSGKTREHTARVFLLEGRRYPLRLEFFKYLEETASIELQWKPPHGVWSVLDDKHLSTASVPRVFVSDTPFPADDRSLGYERGSSISHQWLAATTNGATAAAAEVVNRLPLLAGFEDDTPGRDELLREFVTRFASVAFRRPLTSAEDHLFREVLFADAPNSEAAVRRAILLILKSPFFLYHDLTPWGQTPSQHAIASRLSFGLWDSIPDEPLFQAASNGQLTAVEQIEAQARRMINDGRTRAKMRAFFHHWLEIDQRDLMKDSEIFPEFDEAAMADLRHSLELFLDQVVWSEQSDYRQLLLADYLLLNPRLHGLYQAQQPSEADAADGPESGFKSVAFSPDRRAGVLTHPYLLSAFAYHNNSSPVHRGVFLTRNIIGRNLKPPPIAVAFNDDEFAPNLTMREKITLLTRDKACMSCHKVINPLGFTLESYDAVGRWRDSVNNRPIDTKSEYITVEGDTVEVRNARDVANFAVTSRSAHRAFVAQVFQHLVKQDPAAYGKNVVGRLREQFVEDNFSIQALLARIATLSAMHVQSVSSESVDPAVGLYDGPPSPSTSRSPTVSTVLGGPSYDSEDSLSHHNPRHEPTHDTVQLQSPPVSP